MAMDLDVVDVGDEECPRSGAKHHGANASRGKTRPGLACSGGASSGLPEMHFSFVKRSLHLFCIFLFKKSLRRIIIINRDDTNININMRGRARRDYFHGGGVDRYKESLRRL